MVVALLRPIFSADTGAATQRARPLRGRASRQSLPKVPALLEEAEADMLAFYFFRLTTGRSCAQPTRSSRSTARSVDARLVGIIPNDRALVRLAANVVIEQNDECSLAAHHVCGP